MPKFISRKTMAWLFAMAFFAGATLMLIDQANAYLYGSVAILICLGASLFQRP